MALSRQQIVRLGLHEQDRLMAYILAILHDDHLAEDVFQETFALAVEQADQFADADHLVRWFRVTARNKSKEAIRRQIRQPARLDDDVIAQLEPHFDRLPDRATSDTLDALRLCMDQLAPNARRLVELRYARNLSGQKLADFVSQKLNTVYVTLSRAHRALGDCIRKRLAEEGRHV